MKMKKSLFAWCIRTLAISLIPAVVISCASDDDDDNNGTTTPAPTNEIPAISSITPDENSTVVGTSEFTVVFSEAVVGVTTNASNNSCEGTVQLSDGAACLPLTQSTSDNITFTFDPVTDLTTGSYTLTIDDAIADVEGATLAADTTVNFSVQDALTTVTVNLESALSGNANAEIAAAATEIASAARTAVEDDGVTNNLLNVIPAALEGAMDYINSSSITDKNAAFTAVTQSLMTTVNGAASLTEEAPSSRSSELTDAANFSTLLSNIATVVIAKAPDVTAIAALTQAVVGSLDEAGATAEQIGGDTGFVASFVEAATNAAATSTRADIDITAAVQNIGTGAARGAYDLDSITGIDKDAVATAASTKLSETIDNSDNDVLKANKTTITTAVALASTEAKAADDAENEGDGGDNTDNETTPPPVDNETTPDDTDNETTTPDDTDNETTTPPVDNTDNETTTEPTDETGNPTLTAGPTMSGGVVYDNGTDNITYYTPAALPTVTLTASEAGTLSMSTAACTPSSTAVNNDTSTSFTISHTQSGIYTCEFTIVDLGGNASSTQSVGPYNYDRRAPQANVSFNNDNSTIDNFTFPIAINNVTDDFSGFAAYYITDDDSETVGSSTTFISVDNHTSGDNLTVVNYSLSAANRTDNDTKAVKVYLKDNAGNISGAIQGNVTLGADSDNPILDNITVDDIGSGTDNASYTDSATVEITINASDNDTGVASGIQQYFIRIDNNTTPTASESGWITFGDNTTVVQYNTGLTAEREYQLYLWVKDGGGNINDNVTVGGVSTAVSDNFTLDLTAPTLFDNVTRTGTTSGSSPYDNASVYTNNETISIGLYYTDNESDTRDNASLVSYYYITDNGSTPNPDNSTGWTALTDPDNTTVPYTLTGYDNLTVDVYVKDNATNISEKRTFNIVLDNETPTAKSGVGLFDDTTKYSLGATDNLTVTFDNESYFWDNASSYNGTGVVKYYLTDNGSFTPSVDNFTNGGYDALGDNVSFTFTLDNTSSDNITAGDNLTLYIWAMDALGNISTDNISSTLLFDNVSPVLSNISDNFTADNLTTVSSQRYTNADNVTIGFSVTEANSGVFGYHFDNDSTTPTADLSDAANEWETITGDNYTYTFAGTHSSGDNVTIYAWAMDNASNLSSNSTVGSIIYDTTAPDNGSYGTSALDNVSDNGTHVTINFVDNATAKVEDASALIYAYLITDNQSLKYTNDNITASASDWDNFTTPALSFDNTSENMTYAIPDGVSGNFTIYVWFKDAAQNISDNFTLDSGKFFTEEE
jgi:hypothetical protein